MVQALIAAGADVNGMSSNMGNRPLHLAASADHPQVSRGHMALSSNAACSAGRVAAALSTRSSWLAALCYQELTEKLGTGNTVLELSINQWFATTAQSTSCQHAWEAPGGCIFMPWRAPGLQRQCALCIDRMTTAQVVALLLASGADTLVSNALRNTPLQLAKSSLVKESLARMATGGPEERSKMQQELWLQHERSISQRTAAEKEAQLE